MGHEDPFPPTRLSVGCGFRKETIAGMRRNGRDAPLPDLPALAPERAGSTQSGLHGDGARDSHPQERSFRENDFAAESTGALTRLGEANF